VLRVLRGGGSGFERGGGWVKKGREMRLRGLGRWWRGRGRFGVRAREVGLFVAVCGFCGRCDDHEVWPLATWSSLRY